MEKYEKMKVLGKGSFGSAILIKRKEDDALFVVKEIPLGKMSKKERDDARKECAVLQQLNHPNIVRYVEQFETQNNLYIVMEYCNDSDLGEKVKECRGPMKESTILYYFSQVCLAMEYLHSKHILHRDIKTMNVFLMKNGAVKLGDFGIATVLQNTMAVAKTVCGTPYYFSPELCRNKPYNSKSDMWSLGILLYECATGGRHPFDGNNISQLMHRIVKTPHAPLSSQYSHEFRHLVDWCLQKDPSRRPSIRQTLAYPLVRQSLEHLEEHLLLATQCKVRLKDLIDYSASLHTPLEKENRPTQSLGLRPGQVAALAQIATPPVSPLAGVANSEPADLELVGMSTSIHRDASGDSSPFHSQELRGSDDISSPAKPAESLQKLMENISRAQQIRRRIDAGVPTSKPSKRGSAQTRFRIKPRNLFKPVYRSPYAQPCNKEPNRIAHPLPGMQYHAGEADAKKEDVYQSRFFRPNPEPARNHSSDSLPAHRVPYGGSSAFPRKWNQHVHTPPSSSNVPTPSKPMMKDDMESSSSLGNVMWHAPPQRNLFSNSRRGEQHSPLLHEPRSPMKYADKPPKYSRALHAPPKRLSPLITSARASSADDVAPPRREMNDPQSTSQFDNPISLKELLESTYDANLNIERSKSEGGTCEPTPIQAPTQLQLLETYSTFEAVRKQNDELLLTANDSAASLKEEHDKEVSSDAGSEGETLPDDSYGSEALPAIRGSTHSRSNSDEAELIDVNYEIHEHNGFHSNNSAVEKQQKKINLNCLPSVDFGNRNPGVQPLYLPTKGEQNNGALHRHLSSETALYAGMSREAPTQDEELYLQRQRRRSPERRETVLPAVLETLRTNRATESNDHPLTLLKQRHLTDRSPKSSGQSNERKSSDRGANYHIYHSPVVPLSLSNPNTQSAESPVKGDSSAPSQEYTEMLQYLGMLLRREEAHDEDDSAPEYPSIVSDDEKCLSNDSSAAVLPHTGGNTLLPSSRFDIFAEEDDDGYRSRMDTVAVRKRRESVQDYLAENDTPFGVSSAA